VPTDSYRERNELASEDFSPTSDTEVHPLLETSARDTLPFMERRTLQY